MILADTSAWVEFLRRTGDPVAVALRDALRTEPGAVAVTEVVVMELLAGAVPAIDVPDLRTRLLGQPLLPLLGMADYEAAAALYRTCRRSGETIRRMADCLVAVPAIRAGAAILHKDRDFDAIARHSELSVVEV